MHQFMTNKLSQMSKRVRMVGGQCRQALDRAIVVPFELNQFCASLDVKHDHRVYRHAELEALGVQTISWDGQ